MESESPKINSEPGSFTDSSFASPEESSLLRELAVKNAQEINDILDSVSDLSFDVPSDRPQKEGEDEEVVELDEQTDEGTHRTRRSGSSGSEISEISERDDIEDFEQWSLSSSDRQEFAKLFEVIDKDGDGFIFESQAKDTFREYGLDDTILSRVWKLSDVNLDNKLNFDEFCIAKYLLNAHQNGDELPLFLPESFLASINPELLNCVSPVLNEETKKEPKKRDKKGKKDKKRKENVEGNNDNQSFTDSLDRESLSSSSGSSPSFNTLVGKKTSKTEVLLGLKAIDDDKLFILVQKMYDPKKGVPVKTHKSFLKTYKNTFLGRDLIDWLLARNIGKTRERASKLGVVLLERNYIGHAVKDNYKKYGFVFKENHLYQFIDPEKQKKYSQSDFRICIIGEGKSGKTALSVRMAKNEFLEEHFNFEMTGTETYYTKKNFETKEGEKLNIEIMDTGTSLGNEFESNLAKWSEWATGYLIVFNITSKASFDAVPKIFTTLLKVRSFRVTPVLLVGTKGDDKENRKISQEDAETLASRYRCNYIETSSLTGKNVNELLQELVNNIKSVHELTGTSSHKSGWVKMKIQGKKWKKRYYILTDSGLRFYAQQPENESDSSLLKGVIPMLNCKIQSTPFSKTDNEDPRKMSRKGSTVSFQKDKQRFCLLDRNNISYELFFPTEEIRNQLYNNIEQKIANQSSHNRSRTVSEVPEPSEGEKSETNLSREEIIAKGVQLFNRNSKKGMAFLISKQILKDDIEEVSNFLYSEPTLKRVAIGEFIGNGNGFNNNVLGQYVKKFNFKGMEFDEALRLFLSKFTLPREAQQIDRIMEKFAIGYCEVNPTVFESSDVGYILAFSLIMLNTDAHNPNIKPENKMTKSQFVYNNRGINNGKDLDHKYLEQLYDCIVKNEIQMHHERDEFIQWDKQGWAHIQTIKAKDKKTDTFSRKKGLLGTRFWCIISACCLYTFESPQDKKPFHIIPLNNLQIDSIASKDEKLDKEFSGFILYNPNSVIKTAVGGKEIQLKELVFHFDSPKAKCEWMLVFKVNLVSTLEYNK